MAALFIVGAEAPGSVTPIRDNARLQAGVEGNQGTANSPDSASVSHESPLLFDACHCLVMPGCVVCRRWDRNQRTVRARRALWVQRGWV